MIAVCKDIPFFCIHLMSEKVREPFMIHFQNCLGRQVQTFPALIGKDIAGPDYPRRHPHEAETSLGNIGCTESHIRLLQKLLDEQWPAIGIFEDDAEAMKSAEEIQAFVDSANAADTSWDILLLGASEWVESKKQTPELVRVTRFWGTHAVLVKQHVAQKVIETHRNLLEKGFAYPADWLYAQTIKEYGLVAYGPVGCKSLIRQKPGLVSAINGKVRT